MQKLLSAIWPSFFFYCFADNGVSASTYKWYHLICKSSFKISFNWKKSVNLIPYNPQNPSACSNPKSSGHFPLRPLFYLLSVFINLPQFAIIRELICNNAIFSRINCRIHWCSKNIGGTKILMSLLRKNFLYQSHN